MDNEQVELQHINGVTVLDFEHALEVMRTEAGQKNFVVIGKHTFKDNDIHKCRNNQDGEKPTEQPKRSKGQHLPK